jgi:hypothetical protein
MTGSSSGTSRGVTWPTRSTKGENDDGSGGASDEAGHHASWRGAAVEHPIAATIALAVGGRVSVAQTLWDADGVDVLLDGPDPSTRLLVQVKSISSANVNATMRGPGVSLVRDATFRVRDDFWLPFVLTDMSALTFEKSWLVPAADFPEKTTVNMYGRRRFANGTESKNSKWTAYRFEPARLSPPW